MFLWIIIAPMVLPFERRAWRKKHSKDNKTLSFAIGSMEVQKTNFKIINFLFVKLPKCKKFLKKWQYFF